MAKPTIPEFLALGPLSFPYAAQREKKEQARETALSLLELQDLAQVPKDPNAMTSESGMQFNVPGSTTSAARMSAELPFVIKDAGYSPDAIMSARAKEADLVDQRARNEALLEALKAPELNPLLGADIANKNTVSRGSTVKVRHHSGEEVYYNQRPRLDGGFDYEPATDATGAPLRVPQDANSPYQPTPLQKDTAFIARTLGIDEKDALGMKLSLKGKAPDEAWADLVKSVATSQNGRYGRNPELLRQKATEIWSVARPGEPIPTEASAAPAPAPVPAPTPAAPARPAPAPAPAAASEPTAVNRQTGERLVFRNGQWQPLK